MSGCPMGFEKSHSSTSNSGSESRPESRSAHMHLQGLPLGPDSLLWKYFDNRMAFVAATGIKQLMMREIDSGVDQHSKFFSEIVERTVRSMRQISDAVFDKDNGAEAGLKIRDFHLDITGKMPDGKRYHALHPQLWADTHITFMDGIYMVADRFDGHELTDDEKEILWMEGISWYQQYGVTDSRLPADYAEYKQRSDELVDEYMYTGTAKRALAYSVNDTIPRPNAVPALLWKALELPMKPVAGIANAVVVSGLPDEVRERYKDDIPYNIADKLAVFALEKTTQAIDWDKVPGYLRYPKSVYDNIRKTGKYHRIDDELFSAGYTAASTVGGRLFGAAKALMGK